MPDFQYMTPEEIYSHIEKFGTDEQRQIADALYEAPEPLPDWDDCPNCGDACTAVDVLEQKIIDAKAALE